MLIRFFFCGDLVPESILTYALSPLFDAAIKKEASTNSNFFEENRSSVIGRGNSGHLGLPQGPKSGLSVRKPPSLSTLAAPSFSGIPPPSILLVAEIRSLISQLPQENYDLLRTVVDLIKATCKESTKTKMPLSNLLLVFCPSLNMTPPLLRVLCEAEGIWTEVMDSPPPPPLPMKDGLLPKQEEADTTDSGEMEDDDMEGEVEEKSLISSGRASLDTSDDPSSGYHASEEEDASLFEDGQFMRRRIPERNGQRSAIPTVYLDTRSHYSSSSASSPREPLEPSERHHSHHLVNSRDDMVTTDDDGYISSASRPDPLVPQILSPSPPLCSSSVESVASSTSEPSASFSQLSVWDNGEGEGKMHGVGPVKIVEPDSILSTSPTTPTKKLSISHSLPINDDSVHFPRLPSISSARPIRRISIPLLSLPNFSPPFLSSGDVDRPKDDDSPCPSPTSTGGGVHMLNNKSKRPSLRLLFSKNKKSGSSLNSLAEAERSENGIPFISSPIPQHHPPSPVWDSGTSDSSGSTPLSAVTAASGMSSRSHLPPVLDTSIEGSSLRLGLGFDRSPPETAIPLKRNEDMNEQEKLVKVDVDATGSTPSVTISTSATVGSTNFEEIPPQTPVASRISTVSAQPPSSVAILPHTCPSLAQPPQSSVSVSQRPFSSLETPSSPPGFSAPSPQLSLLDNGEEEDWTQIVLSAAERL